MKIFNLTDVSTPVLEQRHLTKQTFSVSGKDIAPGASIEVDPSVREHAVAQTAFLVACGALALDKVPDSYTKGKQSVVEEKYKAIADVAAPEPTPDPTLAPEPTPEPGPVVEASADDVREEDRLPTTDAPPARRRGR